MIVYDLTVKFSDKEQAETRTFYSKKAVNNGLKTLKSNEKIYGFKVLNHTITEREATQEEINIHNKHLKLMEEIDGM